MEEVNAAAISRVLITVEVSEDLAEKKLAFAFCGRRPSFEWLSWNNSLKNILIYLKQSEFRYSWNQLWELESYVQVEIASMYLNARLWLSQQEAWVVQMHVLLDIFTFFGFKFFSFASYTTKLLPRFFFLIRNLNNFTIFYRNDTGV